MDFVSIIRNLKSANNIVVLTGAGISTESGLPTFRGSNGYWTKGSKNYHPMELATFSFFNQQPELVWEWYHFRRKVYRNAIPNKGHFAITEMEKIVNETSDRKFHLITQNVDGLHLRAGSNPETTFQVHGNINFMRCVNECTKNIYEIPEKDLLPVCPKCEELARPHVLWFDELYNESYFKFTSSLELADKMDFLFVIGTSLQTNLPYQMVMKALSRNIPIVEINPEPTDLANYGAISFKEKSGDILPKIIEELRRNS